MSDTNDIQKLIRLKRYEQPRDEYFENFLAEFQRRQRSELLQRSARSLFFERLGTYFSEFGKMQWAAAGVAACAAIGAVAFFATGGGSNVSPILASVNQNPPMLAEQNAGVDLWDVSFNMPSILVASEEESVALEAAAMARERVVRLEYDLRAIAPSLSRVGVVPAGLNDVSPEALPDAVPDRPGPSYINF
jgi:hypothetical protein